MRDSGGKFMKGCSGNPNGRPKIPNELREKIRLACPGAVDRLIGFMDDENPKIAMWAITELLDRGYGKAIQQQEINMDVAGLMDIRGQIRMLMKERDNGRTGAKEADRE